MIINLKFDRATLSFFKIRQATLDPFEIDRNKKEIVTRDPNECSLQAPHHSNVATGLGH